MLSALCLTHGRGAEDSNSLPCLLYSILRIGHTEQCPCGTGSQTTEYLLQSCSIYEPLRKGIWPNHTPVARKLYGSLGDLRYTATFMEENGVSMWRTSRRRSHVWRRTDKKLPEPLPDSCLRYLRDGSAQTIVRAATLR